VGTCAFSLHFDTTSDALFQSARTEIINQGGTFTGTPQQGQASLPTDAGTVYWNYLVQGQNLKVTVTDKPWLVSCAAIQQQMAELVASVPRPTINTVGEPVSQPPPFVSPSPPFVSPNSPFVSPSPPFRVTTPPYGLWFIGGTLTLLTMFWASRRLKWL
jgi:hypothetical protein